MILLQNQEPAFYIWHLSTKSKPIGVGKKGFQGNYSLQNQGPSLSPSLTSTESRSDRSKEKWSHGNDITTESRTCILHLTLSTKSKPIGVGKKRFQGNYSLQNQGPSLSPSLTSTESRSEGMTLMSMFLLQNQEPAFCIWHLSTKSKPIGVGKRGFRGTILYRIKVLPSHHPSPLQNQDLKVWHWWACFYYKIKDLMTSPALFSPKSVPYPKCKVLCTPSWGLGPLVYKSTESGTYQDRVQKWSKLVILGWLPAHGPWFCSTIGFQTGSPESKVFGAPTPLILERKLQPGCIY